MQEPGHNSLRLTDPLEGCFFCDPEPWRTIFSGEHTRIVAGAGPLCPGYVIIAPKEHIHTAAELPEIVFWESQAVFEILKRALRAQYGPSYTAYEHARVGACVTLEAKGDLSTFCHHAHRVVIPHGTNCTSGLTERLDVAHALDTPDSLRMFRGRPYIFYETAAPHFPLLRLAFTESRGIPSQFMRRLLTTALGTNRKWNWAEDHRIAEMVDTTARLRGEFLGLELDAVSASLTGTRTLNRNVSIDGLAHVGKTSLGRLLSARFGRPLVDTGLIFRHLALSAIRGRAEPTPERIVQFLLTKDVDPGLRTIEVTEAASKLSSDPHVRKRYHEILSALLPSLTPCILVGRDAWRFMRGDDCRFVIEADFETRLRRRLLHIARYEGYVPFAIELENHIRRADARDRVHLPTEDNITVIRLLNGRQPLHCTTQAALDALGAHQ